jgi:putative flippase GtrA
MPARHSRRAGRADNGAGRGKEDEDADDDKRAELGVSRFLRYASVGAVATAVHYAVLAGSVEAGLLSPPFAAALGAWIGAQVAFAGNARFTFAAAPVTVGAWLRFQVTAVLGALISFTIVGLGVRAGLHYLLAQVLATLVALGVTYEVNRRWSFATPGRR